MNVLRFLRGFARWKLIVRLWSQFLDYVENNQITIFHPDFDEEYVSRLGTERARYFAMWEVADKANKALLGTNESLVSQISTHQATIASQLATISNLEARIQELELQIQKPESTPRRPSRAKKASSAAS